MKKQYQILFLFLGFILCLYQVSYSQGSTTSSVTGVVTDQNNKEALIGANVVVEHESTGAKYYAVANIDGNFRIINMNIGGPYTITASFIGYENYVKKGVYLTLGQSYEVKILLGPDEQILDEVVVESSRDGEKTGSETNIDAEMIALAPTVSRSLNDLTRLTPQANFTNDGGISIAGINNRFNAIFIDGAVNNDVFGLAQSGTNGGQAGISPISIDAIEQVQVVISPYDVKLGGFAGGGLNVVTKSGTNNFHGSAYYLFRNEKLAGKTPTDNPSVKREKLSPFSSKTYGFTFGGPIVKNKLFFFINTEIQRDDIPKPFSFDDYEGDSDKSDLDALVQHLEDTYDYDPGTYLNNVGSRKGEKFLAKFDWNIGRNHKLTARHSYVKGETRDFDQNARPNSRTIRFQNSGILFPSITNSSAIELKSSFGNNFSNNLIIGYTSVNDDRSILGSLFPRVEATDGAATIHFGTDAFSYTNNVQQKVLTLTNNFSWFKGKHTFTFGTHNEYFNFLNQFVIFSTPLYFYGDLDSFISGSPAFSLFGHELPTNVGDPLKFGDDATNLKADFRALQLAFYVQDEIQVNDKFRLSLGLRADIPIFLNDAPQINDDFNMNTIPLIESYGYDVEGAQASRVPKSGILWSPRVGFNWDIKGDKKALLRGGVGVFTSRIPFVWPSGIYLRNGLGSGFSPGFGPFTTTPEEWETRANTTKPTGDVDMYAKKFKYPQIFRTNLGIDKKLPLGISGSLDIMYTKTLNNIFAQNLNIKPSIATLEGADDRPIFNSADQIDDKYGRISFLKNTSKGYTFNISTQLKKSFGDKIFTSLAYSYTTAASVFDGFNAIGSSLWRDKHTVNGRNSAEIATSGFSTGSRVTAFLSYKATYGKHFATTFSLFYSGQSGQPYSYTYNDAGALTNEDSQERSLIYVPKDASEIIFDELDADGNQTFTSAQQQTMWNEFNAFVENDKYLSSRRGKYAERNESRSPFEGVVDLKILQDFYITTQKGKKHTFQLGFDIFNFSNFLNKNWGRKYFVGSTNTENKSFELLNFEGFVPGTKRPIYTFDNPENAWDVLSTGVNSARWYAQFTLRYKF